MEELLKYMKALVLIQLDQAVARGEGVPSTKAELLLAATGISAREISALLGKNLKAVQKTIERGRKANPR